MMKRQQGAALIVVLSLLTISLMVGLSSMQSSQIDERLAGNYKAQSVAQMGAEEAASEMYKEILLGNKSSLTVDPDEFVEGERWSAFSGFANDGGRVNNCISREGISSCYLEFTENYKGHVPGKYILAFGAVFDGEGSNLVAESQPVFVELEFPSGMPNVPGTHSCYGEACSYQSGGNSELSGMDYLLPDDASCNGNACRNAQVSPDPENKDACYYPDVSNYSGCRTERHDNDGGRPAWEEYVSGLNFDQTFQGNDTVPSTGSRAAPAFIEIKSGDVSRGKGNTNTIGVIVVRNGATFDISGNGHHEGLIIVEEGARLEYSGTPVLYGAIVTLDGREANDLKGKDKDDGYDLDIGGNTNIRYSKAALNLITESSNSSGGGPAGIKGWN